MFWSRWQPDEGQLQLAKRTAGIIETWSLTVGLKMIHQRLSATVFAHVYRERTFQTPGGVLHVCEPG